jgi:hypothetical protein
LAIQIDVSSYKEEDCLSAQKERNIAFLQTETGEKKKRKCARSTSDGHGALGEHRCECGEETEEEIQHFHVGLLVVFASSFGFWLINEPCFVLVFQFTPSPTCGE